jgi:methionyl-tRNA formyltransferase
MRTVFLGTSDFAAAVLTRLAGARGAESGVQGKDLTGGERLEAALATGAGRAQHRPLLVITRPDRPAGRGRKLQAPPVAETARVLGLRLAQPESVNEQAACELIASVSPEVIVVCAFGALIKEPLLSAYEMLNVHPSLLPRWRGAAPIERAIMAGDERTGVSIMRLTAGLDSGPVCLSASESIHADDTFGSLAGRLERTGGDLLLSALSALDRGQKLAFAEQDERQVTYAEKIGPAERLLDTTHTAIELERAVRALSPHIGARVALSDGTLLGVQRAAPAMFSTTDAAEGVHARDGRLFLDCAQGALELLEVQPPGKRPMAAEAFLRGHGLPSA